MPLGWVGTDLDVRRSRYVVASGLVGVVFVRVLDLDAAVEGVGGAVVAVLALDLVVTSSGRSFTESCIDTSAHA